MPERRTINGELCERVPRAGDIRPLEIVYIECEVGGHGFHRGALMDSYCGPARGPNGRVALVTGWFLAPVPCAHKDAIVTVQDVEEGYVWRVVDEARDDGWDAFEMEQARVDAAVRAIRVATFEPERIVKVPG